MYRKRGFSWKKHFDHLVLTGQDTKNFARWVLARGISYEDKLMLAFLAYGGRRSRFYSRFGHQHSKRNVSEALEAILCPQTGDGC